ncbi:hypothetical protein [Mobilicoccus pelagius]|uniref:hypothetical protein n=1 Tax=Mobilicoccus pelagius TaxID=746032 RepID=UPI00058E9C0F|nr:hypothetical protein [Mobilicoccus pelagius]
MTGPVVDRRPPRESAASAVRSFARRDRSSGPTWASGVRIEAADLPRAAVQLVRPRDVVEVALPGDRWDELSSSNRAFDLVRGRRVVWSVPLDVQRTPLEEIASGRHDDAWTALGQLAARDGGQSVVRIVLPAGQEAERCAAAFRRAAVAVRRTPGVAVEWAVREGASPEVVAAAWPGDDVVDVVGVPLSRKPSWAAQVAGPGGLADWSTWARAHRRRLALHWELDEAVDAERVERVADWLDVSARTSVLAYDSVAPTSETRSDALATYRELW